MPMSDQELMHEVAAGNEAAFGELYDRFGKLVFRVAWQFFPNRSESEDAVQEVFIRLWRTADRFDAERAKLVTWVMLIARRHMIDRLRRKQTRPTTQDYVSDPMGDGPNQTEDPTEIRAELRGRMERLSELQKEVVTRTYFQGFTLKETAEQLGAPLGTVKSALSRALATMREGPKPEM